MIAQKEKASVLADPIANIITLKVDGPMVCRGDITLVNAACEVLLKDQEAWLCRCGESKKMPFCDACHRRGGFKADSATLPVFLIISQRMKGRKCDTN